MSPKTTKKFDTIDDTVEAFKNGSFILILDSASRENECDLTISATALTTEKMSFMIRYTSGVICVAMPPSLCSHYSLPQMVPENEDSNGTAYTVSISVKSAETSTGISAHDRALTCRRLASPETAGPEDFARPGHVFPLQAREGGVRERQGHTEAAVEFCRLAGLPLVGVLGECVEEGAVVDGETEIVGAGMMREEGALEFAERWRLKICRVEDLVAFVEGREGKLVD